MPEIGMLGLTRRELETSDRPAGSLPASLPDLAKPGDQMVVCECSDLWTAPSAHDAACCPPPPRTDRFGQESGTPDTHCPSRARGRKSTS